jgi:hypothetical protein
LGNLRINGKSFHICQVGLKKAIRHQSFPVLITLRPNEENRNISEYSKVKKLNSTEIGYRSGREIEKPIGLMAPAVRSHLLYARTLGRDGVINEA